MDNLHSWLLEKKQNGIAPEDYLRCLFEKATFAETREDWEKLLPWNIETTPYKISYEFINLWYN